MIRRAGRTGLAVGKLGGGVEDRIDVPPEVRPGDLMVLTLQGGAVLESGDMPKSTCTDPRMTRIDVGSHTDDIATGNRSTSFWVGRFKAGDQMAVTIQLWVGEGQYDQFGLAMLDIYRDDSGAGVVLEPGRENWLPNTLRGGVAPVVTPTDSFPRVRGTGHTGLLVVAAWYSGFAGLDQKINFGREHFTDVWEVTGNPLGTGGYLDIYTFLSSEHEIPAVRFSERPGTPLLEAIISGGAVVWAYVIGMRPDAPPVTRQYPRDDGLGLSAGPRKYPVRRGPAGGRIVGGHT